MTLFDLDGPATRWHFGFRYTLKAAVGRRRHRWVNGWLEHPCSDLALPLEVGARAAHHRERNS